MSLSNQQKDIVRGCFSKIHQYQQEMSGLQLHKGIGEQAVTLLKLMPEDPVSN